MNSPSNRKSMVLGGIAILLILALSIAPLQSAGTHGKDPTGTSESSLEFDSDGEGLKDGEDAAPNDPVIEWKKPAYERFAAIEMPGNYFSAASNLTF